MGMGTPNRPLIHASEWNSGACDILAVALHRMYGFPIFAQFEYGHDAQGDEVLGYLVHAWVKIPDGRCLDASGIFQFEDSSLSSIEDTDDAWVKGYKVVQISDSDPHLLDTREEDDYSESIFISGAYNWIQKNLLPLLKELGIDPIYCPDFTGHDQICNQKSGI